MTDIDKAVSLPEGKDEATLERRRFTKLEATDWSTRWMLVSHLRTMHVIAALTGRRIYRIHNEALEEGLSILQRKYCAAENAALQKARPRTPRENFVRQNPEDDDDLREQIFNAEARRKALNTRISRETPEESPEMELEEELPEGASELEPEDPAQPEDEEDQELE